MRKFMVEIRILTEFMEGEQQLIPRQKKYIDQLMKTGLLVNYSLSMDRRKLWLILHVTSVNDVHKIMQSFPIFNYMQYTVHNLMFHYTNSSLTPQFWLN